MDYNPTTQADKLTMMYMVMVNTSWITKDLWNPVYFVCVLSVREHQTHLVLTIVMTILQRNTATHVDSYIDSNIDSH